MFNKRAKSLSVVLAALAALSACSTAPRVRYDYDAKADIGKYHSYVWEQMADDSTAGGSAFKNPINIKRLQDAVNANMAKRGLQLAAEGGTPDSYVTVAIGTRQNVEADDRVRFGFGFGSWRPGFMSSVNWTTDGLYNYREGRVSVDFYDIKTRQPIWHAAVEQDLTYLTGEHAEARINALVDAMFDKFPGSATADKSK